MSSEEIERLPAGKELDAAVAEQVLGHVWGHNRQYGFLRPADELADLVQANFAKNGKHPDHEAGAWIGPDFSYSLNIAAAWDIVEILSQKGYDAQLHVLRAGLHSAVFTPKSAGKLWPPRYLAGGNTMPVAICRAALLAFHQFLPDAR